MTWDEAYAYVDTVIERECAAHGMAVRVTDPGQLALVSRLLRVGQRDNQPARVKVRATTPGR